MLYYTDKNTTAFTKGMQNDFNRFKLWLSVNRLDLRSKATSISFSLKSKTQIPNTTL